jgi:hypothetical protein
MLPMRMSMVQIGEMRMPVHYQFVAMPMGVFCINCGRIMSVLMVRVVRVLVLMLQRLVPVPMGVNFGHVQEDTYRH